MTPLVKEGEIVGVLEVASFQRFTELERSLLEQLSLTMGLVFDTLAGRVRSERLLRQAQLLAAQAEPAAE